MPNTEFEKDPIQVKEDFAQQLTASVATNAISDILNNTYNPKYAKNLELNPNQRSSIDALLGYQDPDSFNIFDRYKDQNK